MNAEGLNPGMRVVLPVNLHGTIKEIRQECVVVEPDDNGDDFYVHPSEITLELLKLSIDNLRHKLLSTYHIDWLTYSGMEYDKNTIGLADFLAKCFHKQKSCEFGECRNDIPIRFSITQNDIDKGITPNCINRQIAEKLKRDPIIIEEWYVRTFVLYAAIQGYLPIGNYVVWPKHFKKKEN